MSAAPAGAGGRCLVTGATGFIGGHLARRLAGEGRPLRCLARATSDVSGLSKLGVEIVRGDLTEPGSLESAARGCSEVAHCAALVSDWATTTEIRAINVAGTRNVLRAARLAGVRRLVHLSTSDVYGTRRAAVGIAEDHPADRFCSWYAETKREAEAEVARAWRDRALETVILRPATVYGPGSIDVVAPIARALCNGTMLLIGRGRAVAGLCYVENLVDAIVLALDHRDAPGATFNVADGLDVTWRRFTGDLAVGLGCRPARWSLPYGPAHGIAVTLERAYRLARGVTGITLPPLLSRQAVHVLGADQRFSERRLRDTLGWEPRVGYAQGLEATLAWLRASGV